MARDKSFCEKDTLDKMADVFWQQGYKGASMDDLLKQSGLSRSSLYATFGDKRAVFLQSLTRYVEKQKTCITEVASQSQSAAEIVSFLFNYVLDSMECSCNKGCFAVNAAIEWGNTDDEVNTLINQNRDFIVDTVMGFIVRDQQSGLIPSATDAHQLAIFVFNSMSGLQVGARGGVPRRQLEQIRDIVLGLVSSPMPVATAQ